MKGRLYRDVGGEMVDGVVQRVRGFVQSVDGTDWKGVPKGEHENMALSSHGENDHGYKMESS